MALVAFIPVLLIVFTGCLLVFKFELDTLLMPSNVTIEEKAGQRLPFNTLVNDINQKHGNFEIGSWEIFDDGYEADRVYLIKKGQAYWYKIHLNPYTGQVLSEPQLLNHYLSDWLLELHYTLLLNNISESEPELGTLIGLIIAILLSFIGISGLIIYRKFWQRFFTFRHHVNKQIRHRELHKLIGIWCSPILLLIGLTGVYFNLVEYLHETEESEKGPYIIEQRLYSESFDFDKMLEDSQKSIAQFRPTYILFPYEPELDFSIFGEVPTLNVFASQYSSTVSYDKKTGKKTITYDIREQGAVAKLVDSLREIHYGNFAGISSKIAYFIAGIGMLFMAVIGVMMWFSRNFKGERRRAEPQ